MFKKCLQANTFAITISHLVNDVQKMPVSQHNNHFYLANIIAPHVGIHIIVPSIVHSYYLITCYIIVLSVGIHIIAPPVGML